MPPLSAVATTLPAGDVDIRAADCIAFLRSLPEQSVDLVVTDPAYSGMNQHMRFGHGRIVGRYGSAENTRWFSEFHDDPETFVDLLRECHRVLRRDRHIYVMFDSFSLLTLGALMRAQFDVKGVIVWDKVHLGMGHYFRRRHEHIVFASKGRRKISRRDLVDVWAIPRIRRAAYPTQKPVALFERMLSASAEPGYVVCDPFCGSGSSAVAALRAGCVFVGADLDRRAVELARRRCDEFRATGTDPLEAPRVVSRLPLPPSSATA
ncbi:MAG: site-specific DNA-methyltransferase [Candidatus Dormibacteraeota bacterium]|nr:site-specific DNA-methyltransferase [Candidatus Dormibacteraeota bacterium]